MDIRLEITLVEKKDFINPLQLNFQGNKRVFRPFCSLCLHALVGTYFNSADISRSLSESRNS